ncbi:MAG: PAS domain-containing protein [Myxococcota bacterium]|jgi:PAS domain S-box-containing protein|nr:PAS domain-containing protein [Myxococcota bacterium]
MSKTPHESEESRTGDESERVLRLEGELALAQAQLRDERQHLARYRELVESAPLGVLEVSNDGRITSTNAMVLRLLGSPSAQDTQQINMFTFEPLKRSGISEHFRTCFAQRRAVVGDALYTTKWGKTAHFRYHMTPVFDAQGEVSHVQALVEDFTERKAAELALLCSERRLQLVVQHMPVLLNAVDEMGRIVLWNQECVRVTGYAASEMLGRTDLLELLYPDTQYRIRLSELWDAMRGEVIDMETEISCKDGSRRIVAWSIVSRTHSVPGWRSWAIGLDVSERKRAEEEREALIRELRAAATQVKTLTGLLPICANCKMIRDDQGYWKQLEVYISEHSDADFSHGICPDCARRVSEQVMAQRHGAPAAARLARARADASDASVSPPENPAKPPPRDDSHE